MNTSSLSPLPYLASQQSALSVNQTLPWALLLGSLPKTLTSSKTGQPPGESRTPWTSNFNHREKNQRMMEHLPSSMVLRH